MRLPAAGDEKPLKRKRNLLIGHIEEYFSYEEERLKAILKKRKESQKMIRKEG